MDRLFSISTQRLIRNRPLTRFQRCSRSSSAASITAAGTTERTSIWIPWQTIPSLRSPLAELKRKAGSGEDGQGRRQDG